MLEGDDEPLTLSASAMAALADFYAERNEKEEKFRQLKMQAERDEQARAVISDAAPTGDAVVIEHAVEKQGAGVTVPKKLSMDDFEEDWNQSQFWYSHETADTLARELLAAVNIVLPAQSESNAESNSGASFSTKVDLSASTTNAEPPLIVAISAPSTFIALKNILLSLPSTTSSTAPPLVRLCLLEYDSRFAVAAAAASSSEQFVHYDFRRPLHGLPAELRGAAAAVVVDPPFLSDECHTKMAMTVRWLSRSGGGARKCGNDRKGELPDTKVIVCTGERMHYMITEKLYKAMGVQETDFEVVHKNGLQNEFLCYANFESASWRWRQR